MRFLGILILIFVVLAVIVGPQAFFVVDERELAIVTRFGQPVGGSITTAGLNFKLPFIDTVTKFEKRLIVFDAPPDSLLTKDKKRLIIDVYARGRIVDPLQFFISVGNEASATSRALDIISSELRLEIALDDQSEIIKTSRELIMNKVRDQVSVKLADFGIEVVDVRIKRADFPEQIASSIYGRMQAERKRIADRERAEGAKADLEKRAQVDRTAIEIRSAAQRDADIIRGCGEAEAIGIFAASLEQDPEFYTFQRSLEAYKKYLTQNATVVGSAQDLGQLFDDIRQAVIKGAATPPGATGGIDDGGSGASSFESRCEVFRVEFAARKFLADELTADDLQVDQIRLILLGEIEGVDWPNPSLGCPQEGVVYAQVIVPGYRLNLQYEDTVYEIHSNNDGTQIVRCTP